MASKVAARQAAMRERLIVLAQTTITEQGLSALRARDLAREAGCSVGAIYTHFDDLTDLVLAVNGRTFQGLSARVMAEVEAERSDAPTDKLVAIARGYFAYAQENTKLWRALFDLDMPADSTLPDWYERDMLGLFDHITTPLKALDPSLSDTDAVQLARTLFSAVHGIVWLGLENRISGVPEDQINEMIALLLRRFAT